MVTLCEDKNNSAFKFRAKIETKSGD